MGYKDNDAQKRYNREYYLKNKESENSRSKKYNDEHKDDLKIKRKEPVKEYYLKNKDVITEYKKDYYQLNKDRLNEKSKKYREDNKERLNKIKCDRRKIDPLFNLKCSLRASISRSIRRVGHRKTSPTQKILGCSFIEFKSYLETKFEPWMNWNNYGLYNGELNYGWDIDHIVPASIGQNLDEILKLNNYTNLQPLCSKINRDIKRNIL